MPDFQFSEADSPPERPQGAPPEGALPAPTNPEPTPAKPTGFQFSTEDVLAPQPAPTPIPKPVVPIPGPPIPNLKAPTVPAPSIPIPQIPTRSIPTPQIPVAKTSAPAVPNPAIPTPQPIAPKAAVPHPVPRPATVPIAVPAPSVVTPEALSDIGEGAPQDNFSRGIWDIGQKIKGVLDALEGPASWLLRVAAVVGICALAYILAATLFGGAGQSGNPKMAELTKNLDVASRTFMFCLIAASVATLLLGYEDNRLGIAVVVIGLLFHFGVPIVIKQFVGVTRATLPIAAHFRQGGYFVVMVGLVKAVADTAIWLWNLPEKMKTRHANVGVSNQAEAKQRIIAREANMMSPCWKLPFCRESIRKQCPAFLAKTTCWKFGRGCYCDTEMISRIVRGESLDVIKAPTQQSRQGKPPCGRCYIYLEHQTYKFRMLSPLVLPVTVLATWLVWPIYIRFFAIGDKAFNSIFSTLSFNSSNLTSGDMKSSAEAIDAVSRVGSNSAADIAYITQNLFGVLLGFMLLIYISKFIEWAIYKAKW
ncbi:hypothetical protein B1R32_10611 [Abditibacterium utsteinense]|uniref:Uncharacterized protein n=1 Tax=Abditibacterium utsteinense TaxID=1960156 RepID=A0A2S8STP4_9BACT|nr:hypothetical protein [Abditibacterium utsteinense]PQV64167.1 hypothetical protein B1R32_10611 [Abditibacterium utsteinense]